MQGGQHEEAGPSDAFPATPAPPRRAPSRVRQFGAVLRKNYLLQTRSRRVWWGGAGWLALLVEVRAVRTHMTVIYSAVLRTLLLCQVVQDLSRNVAPSCTHRHAPFSML